jgi:hypothetical protein
MKDFSTRKCEPWLYKFFRCGQIGSICPETVVLETNSMSNKFHVLVTQWWGREGRSWCQCQEGPRQGLLFSRADVMYVRLSGWKNRTSGETNMASPWPTSLRSNPSRNALGRSPPRPRTRRYRTNKTESLRFAERAGALDWQDLGQGRQDSHCHFFSDIKCVRHLYSVLSRINFCVSWCLTMSDTVFPLPLEPICERLK